MLCTFSACGALICGLSVAAVSGGAFHKRHRSPLAGVPLEPEAMNRALLGTLRSTWFCIVVVPSIVLLVSGLCYISTVVPIEDTILFTSFLLLSTLAIVGFVAFLINATLAIAVRLGSAWGFFTGLAIAGTYPFFIYVTAKWLQSCDFESAYILTICYASCGCLFAAGLIRRAGYSEFAKFHESDRHDPARTRQMEKYSSTLGRTSPAGNVALMLSFLMVLPVFWVERLWNAEGKIFTGWIFCSATVFAVRAIAGKAARAAKSVKENSPGDACRYARHTLCIRGLSIAYTTYGAFGLLMAGTFFDTSPDKSGLTVFGLVLIAATLTSYLANREIYVRITGGKTGVQTVLLVSTFLALCLYVLPIHDSGPYLVTFLETRLEADELAPVFALAVSTILYVLVVIFWAMDYRTRRKLDALEWQSAEDAAVMHRKIVLSA